MVSRIGITPFFIPGETFPAFNALRPAVTAEFARFRELVEKHRTFVLTTHINPDGDGLGCEMALQAFLVSQGKTVRILNHSETPENYRFLDPERSISRFDPGTDDATVRNAEVIVVLDLNHPDRLVSMQTPVVESRAVKVCIDHHLEPSEFADLYMLDEATAATGEILYHLLASFGGTLFTERIATSLYTAIMTDTGSFRYPKTDAELHRIVAHLIERGADPVRVYQEVFEQGPANRLALLGRALASLQTSGDGMIAYMVVTKKMFEETNTGESDTDAFVPYTLAVRNVRIGLMFTELTGEIKVSFRSKGEVRINELAKEFGGNGHMNAAGARVTHAPLVEVVRHVVERAQRYLN